MWWHNKAYRVLMNVLARLMRMAMKATGVVGHFCVSANDAYFERDGIKFVYHFTEFGVGGNIDSAGNTELETRKKLFGLLNNNSVFFDIGAHEGLYTLTAKKRFPRSTVVAIEPFSRALMKNIALNDLDGIRVFDVAVGQNDGCAAMTTNQRSSNHVTSDGACSVKMTTLDALCDAEALPRPDVIKCDVEGYEFTTLRGAKKLLRTAKPIIVTEINQCYFRYHRDLDEFVQYMSGFGYRMYRLQAETLQPITTTMHAINDLPPSADSNYWWLPPEGRH